MKVEILGSGGAVTIPRPGCSCRVCVEAREKGAPYARTGPSVFVHGPDVLIDTPEESKQQLNRSQVTRIGAVGVVAGHSNALVGLPLMLREVQLCGAFDGGGRDFIAEGTDLGRHG